MKKFKAESKRLLDLMINSIYTNREIFLRELISNASDALDKLHFISLTDDKVNSDFKITVDADKDARTLTITDNGIGMTKQELEDNLGTIAASGTFKYKQSAQNEDTAALIGQFGVGFYSAFMVSDKITVVSKAYGNNDAYKWASSGADGYDIEPCQYEGNGTKITLHLKSDDEDCKYSDFLDAYELEHLIKKYSDYVRYPIMMQKDDKEANIETVNSMVPIWKKSKAELTDEQKNEFYKHKFGDFQNPLKTIHAKIEGNIEYNAMLFVPAEPPFNYYTKDFERGLKLYCNGVLIMDKCKELIPEYLGFICGIVDSPDLSLNISREMLQQDRQLRAISTSLEKRILNEFEKLLLDDRQGYEKLFEKYSKSIKFGAYDNFGQKKDMVKDLLLFYSSTLKAPVTLKEYVSRMQKDNQNIYYATGETVEKIELLPQMEKLKEQNIEVLYLTDNIDEFVFKVLREYDGKSFKNACSDDAFAQSEQEKEILKKADQDNEQMFKFIEEKLSGKVNKVRASMRLKSYPSCLSSEGEVSMEMERVLNAVGNGGIKATKILELNPEHGLFKKLVSLYQSDKDLFMDYVTVLYNQALIFEGYNIDDSKQFIDSLNKIITANN